MGTYNTRLIDSEYFAKCEVCLDYLPIEYYFTEGDTIICKECQTEYKLVSLQPVKLSIVENRYHDAYIHEIGFNK